jgi:NadR type nicotinamide-nucleotide adenylyltransferase
MNIKRVAVTGPESTGKSLLSKKLAQEFKTVWVPEYAREYLLKLPDSRKYNEEDLINIAQGQLTSEDRLINSASDVLICDTDLLVIKIWSEFKYNRCHPWILEQINNRKYDLYLLCHIDIPWEFDLLRENPGLRKYFYVKFLKELNFMDVKYVEIKGEFNKRMKTAINAVSLLL